MRAILLFGLALVFLGLLFLFSYSKAPATDVNDPAAALNAAMEQLKEPAPEAGAPAKEVKAAADEDKGTQKEYAGVGTCKMCHEKVYEQLAKTPMGILFLKHPRNSREKLGCETCHGPGQEHADSGGKVFAGMILFTKGTTTPASVRNEVCLKCHQKRERLFWQGSPHDNNGMACTTCHVVHTGPGIMSRHQLARLTVEDTCAPCHKKQVKEELRFSHHPLREGKMSCVSCHNPHGTTSPHLVRGFSNRELCFKCHAQYRGPFIFQHPPVMEDCFNCHQPHGSPYPELLKAPVIRLCRECHIAFHEINFAPGGVVRPNQMMGGACTNCHRNIHGSNNVNGNLFFQ